jgi:hypothetical protein
VIDLVVDPHHHDDDSLVDEEVEVEVEEVGKKINNIFAFF